MKKIIGTLVLCASLFGGTYDYRYSVTTENSNVAQKQKDFFMYGNFEEIIRFDSILMENNTTLADGSDEIYSSALEKIDELKEAKRQFYVTIIGHTDTPTDDANEKSVDSTTYANAIQNLFRYSLDTNESKNESEEYAHFLQEKLVNDGVDVNSTFVEYRSGLENDYLETSCEAREYNNRVMLSIYLAYQAPKDSDGDGVFDEADRCPNTPEGLSVDTQGCPLDSDGDGVYDYEDQCPNTPQGVDVDAKGCPLDSDGDGILDYQDECPNTQEGLQVNTKGCPIFKSLALNYKTASADILEESMPKVLEFADFMKKYSAYKAKIIGHTDSIGKEQANMQLSQARAQSVRDVLVAEGIDASRLEASGRGEYEPIASNRTIEGRKANRRIEVQLFE